jgi:hypothetical protein
MSRRLSALIVAAAMLLVVLPGGVAAGSLIREVHTRTSLFCEALSGPSGTVSLYLESDDQWGTFGDLAIWTGVVDGPPQIITSNSLVTITTSGATASFDLVEYRQSESPEDPPFGDPAGSATLTATFEPAGEPEEFSYTDRHGNTVAHVDVVSQTYTVTGTLEVDLLDGPDGTYDLGSCSATSETMTVSRSNPNASVSSGSHISLRCEWITPDGMVTLSAATDPFGAWSDVFITHDGVEVFGFDEPVLTSTVFDAAYDLMEPETGEPITGASATASATLARTSQRVNERGTFGNAKFRAIGWVLSVDGSLTFDIAGDTTTLVMDDTSCDAEDVHVQEIVTSPGGPRLKNDAPAGAVPLSPGTTVEVRTGGTADEPEAPCVIEDGDHAHDIPLGHTAWWTFTGTGDSVTIDTAGSDFDTVVAVYTLEEGDFQLVGCVDDVFDPETGEGSLQASITIDTVEGETYYVQAGGFGGSTGTLRLHLE